MTMRHARQYDIYPIRNPDIYALLDKAKCAVVPDDNDSMQETLIIAESARYENMQLRNSIARFEVYCPNGYAFRLVQTGTSVERAFIFHSPTLLAFPQKITFKQAMELGNIAFDAFLYGNPFPVQGIYDMVANMPVSPQEAAFALARMSILSWIAFSFDSVQINFREEE